MHPQQQQIPSPRSGVSQGPSPLTTMVRPMMPCGPEREMTESWMSTSATPPLAVTLPRSPTCLHKNTGNSQEWPGLKTLPREGWDFMLQHNKGSQTQWNNLFCRPGGTLPLFSELLLSMTAQLFHRQLQAFGLRRIRKSSLSGQQVKGNAGTAQFQPVPGMIIPLWHCPITWHPALPHIFYQCLHLC